MQKWSLNSLLFSPGVGTDASPSVDRLEVHSSTVSYHQMGLGPEGCSVSYCQRLAIWEPQPTLFMSLLAVSAVVDSRE